MDVSCIPKLGSRCLFDRSFISFFFVSYFQTSNFFVRNCEAYKFENWYRYGPSLEVSVCTEIELLFGICRFISSLLFLSNFHLKFS